MTTLEEGLRHLAEALGERVVVPPFAHLEARRRRRRRVRLVAVPALAAAAVLVVAVTSPLAHRSGSTLTSASRPTTPAAGHAPVVAEPARACTPGDLRARLTLDAPGAGQGLGTIDVWNAGPEACSPGATVTVTAMDGDRAVTTRAALADVALTAAAHAAGPDGPAAGEEHLALQLVRPEGACPAADLLAPSELVLTFAAGARVALPDSALRGMKTCRGEFAVRAADPAGAAPS